MEDNQIDLRSRYLGLDLVEVLTAETPSDIISERPIRGGGSARYVAGHHFIRRLNDVFGFLWSFDIVEGFEKDGQVIVKGRLTVKVPGRSMTRELPDGTKEIIRYESLDITKTQYGGSEVKRWSKDVKNARSGDVTYKSGSVMDLGNDFKSASTDAFKKCSTQLGLFLDVYSGGEDSGGGPSKQQLDAFYMRAGEASMDVEKADTWCLEQLGMSPKDVDSLDLMGLIPKLMDLASAGGTG